MKIMTFNTQHCLNYLEQRIDFDVMARAILSCGADIVGLNEMRDAGKHPDYTAQVAELAARTGMRYHYFAKAYDFSGGPYGNGFLSHIPILKAETLLIPDPNPRKYNGYYETRCVLKVTLEGDITVLVSHFGLNPDEQESAVATVTDLLCDTRCIFMGDLNVTPDNPLLDPIRARMTDTADFFTCSPFSFPSDKPDRKIDYIFVSPDAQVLAAEIPAIIASDHRPHTAEVTFA